MHIHHVKLQRGNLGTTLECSNTGRMFKPSKEEKERSARIVGYLTVHVLYTATATMHACDAPASCFCLRPYE